MNSTTNFSLGKDLLGNDLDEFYKNYRDYLEKSNQQNIERLNTERTMSHQSLMNQANARGMLYSEFPAYAKTKYDTQSYIPALANQQSSYMTGLNTMQQNMLKMANSILDAEDKIKLYNQLTADKNATTAATTTTTTEEVKDIW